MPYRPKDIKTIVQRTNFSSYLRDKKPDARLKLLTEMAKKNTKNARILTVNLKNQTKKLFAQCYTLIKTNHIDQNKQNDIQTFLQKNVRPQLLKGSLNQQLTALSALSLVANQDPLTRDYKTFTEGIRRKKSFNELHKNHQKCIAALIQSQNKQ